MATAEKNWDMYLVAPDDRVRLGQRATGATDFFADKKTARQELKHSRKRIDELAGALAIEQRRTLLVILQGVDASGKDGAVRKVFTGVNPQYCKVVSFKEPDSEERDHDYLWRIYRAMPAKGELGIFNRSHYEDVLVPRARGELTAKGASARLKQIADLERTWTENGTVIRKFFLHISRREQTARFKARLDDPEKHWKVKLSDFNDRRLWPKFMSAYEQVLSCTSTAYAPWYIIPADHKWYRDVAIAGMIVATLEAMRPRIPKPRLDPHRFRL